VLKAWRAVLPLATLLFPVGGIGADSLAAYWAAGASGFGTGSGLYRPGSSAAAVAASATALATACRALPARHGAPTS
jgi:2-dehydro-3-deoxyphosphogalactonate aldolase